MQFDRGYLSPYFATDPESMEVVLEKPYILNYEKKISSVKDLLPILEKVARMGRPLRIIAEDLEGEPLPPLWLTRFAECFRLQQLRLLVTATAALLFSQLLDHNEMQCFS